MATYSPSQFGANGKYDNLGWYVVGGGSRQYDAASGTFGEIGNIHQNSSQIGAGQKVSDTVIAQTNPANVGYINSSISADQMQPPIQVPYASNISPFSTSLSSSVDIYRKTLDDTLKQQKLDVDTKLSDLKLKEQDALGKIGELTTPFREELETTQRESLYINKNFQENQTLIDELDQLLTEGNSLIKQQQEVTGLASVRNPRIQKTMDDVAGRAGVIEAVINARNGQIAQAQNLIDRTVNAIAADRGDQISYYETVLNLNNRDIISLDAESKNLAEEQLNLKKGDLERAQATADYIKQLLLDPATASLMGQAGVKLTDSVEQINSKLTSAQYASELRDQANEIMLKGGVAVVDPSKVPASQLTSFTDSQGVPHYYKMPATGAGDSGLSSGLLKWIEEQLNPDNGVNLTEVDELELAGLIDEVMSPKVSPSAGIGSVYYDSLGRKWVYEKGGWKLVG